MIREIALCKESETGYLRGKIEDKNVNVKRKVVESLWEGSLWKGTLCVVGTKIMDISIGSLLGSDQHLGKRRE